MQEEVEQRTVTLAISTSKMTANVLKSAISKYLAYRKDKAKNGPVKPCGKQSVKKLVQQDKGVTNIEITDKNVIQDDGSADVNGAHDDFEESSDGVDISDYGQQ